MKAVVLAAGNGTRLRPFSHTRPKPLIPLAGKPMLHYLLENIKKAGITETVLVVGYQSEKIEKYFGDGRKLGMKIEYCPQPKQLGTGHAFLQAEKFVNGDFIGLMGDDIYDSRDIKALVRKPKGTTLMAVKTVGNPSQFGIVELNGDKVVSLEEKPSKPKGTLANTGLYRFNTEIFSKLKKLKTTPRGELEVTDALKLCIAEGKLRAHTMLGYWQSMGNLWNILEMNSIVIHEVPPKRHGKVEKGAFVSGDVFIGKNTVIKAGSFIEGPVYIGDNCEIGPFAYIHSKSSIGNNCKLGRVEIKNSVLFDNVTAKHFTYLGDSVVGEGVNLGAGSKTANLRHDKKNIMVEVNGKLADSRRYKLGAMIGDECKIGVNCSILPGRAIGPFSWTSTGAIVDKTVPPASILRANGELQKVEKLEEEFRKLEEEFRKL